MYQALVLGLRDYMRKCGFKSAVLGLSGGIDSALVACLAVAGAGARRMCGAFPCRRGIRRQGSLEDARLLAARLGIAYDVIPIEPPLCIRAGNNCKPVFRRPAGGHDGGKHPGAVARGHFDGAVQQIRIACS